MKKGIYLSGAERYAVEASHKNRMCIKHRIENDNNFFSPLNQ